MMWKSQPIAMARVTAPDPRWETMIRLRRVIEANREWEAARWVRRRAHGRGMAIALPLAAVAGVLLHLLLTGWAA